MTRTPAPSTRAGILDEAARIVTADRNAAYGEPEDLFGAISLIWQAIDMARGERSRDAVDVGLYLAGLKLARAAANPDHRDSFTDLAGYAACAGEIAAQQARRATERAARGAIEDFRSKDTRQPAPGVYEAKNEGQFA